MSHFAKVENGIVTNVIVVEQDVIDSGLFGSPSEWVQTSYNTRGGVHHSPVTNLPDNGTPLRANFAGIGYTYDSTHDVFYAPQPYPSWTISAPTWVWTAPEPMPIDGKPYLWDEPTKSWVEKTTT